jgi:hypothetical protein
MTSSGWHTYTGPSNLVELRVIRCPLQNEVIPIYEPGSINQRLVENGSLHRAGKGRHCHICDRHCAKRPKPVTRRTIGSSRALRKLGSILPDSQCVDRNFLLVTMLGKFEAISQ